VNLSDATVGQLMIPVDKFVAAPHVVNRTPKSELWLTEFTDPDGNRLALMSEIAVGGG